MLDKIPINRAIILTGVYSLLFGTLLLFASPSWAGSDQESNNLDSPFRRQSGASRMASSDSDADNVGSPSRRKPGASRVDPSALSEINSPSRRKPGASRVDPSALSEINSPSRRKPGSTRQDVVNSPFRRKPGSTRQDLVISPLRRQPGSTRQDLVISPLRRKPGSTRFDIALLLQENQAKRRSYQCTSDIYQLTALIPENLQVKTAQATPTLYFDLPSLSTPVEMEFVLQDDQQRVVYAATLQENAKEGIMSLKIPADKGLQPNTAYHWYLSVVCDATRRERDLVVEGLIQRVELDAMTRQALMTASRQEQIRLYQAQGLWQDALQTVVTAYQDSRADELIPLWQSLLKDINLGGLDDAMTQKSFFDLNFQPLSSNPPRLRN